MALGIVKYAYDHSSQLIGVIWFAVSCCGATSVEAKGRVKNISIQIMVYSF